MLVLVLCVLGGASFAAQTPPRPLRALILSGRNNHDWRGTTPFLRRTLLDTGRFDVRVTEEPSGLTSATLTSYDLLVSDYNGPRLGTGAEQAIDGFVRGGKGIVLVHAASYAFGGLEILGDYQTRTGRFEPAWTAYGQMTGARWSNDAPKTGHGTRHVFPVKMVRRDHPVTRGLPETLRASDELYHNFRMEGAIDLLAAAFDDPRQNGTGHEEPLIWIKSWGQGRVFHTALGHDVAAMMEPAFVQPLVRGAEWAATGEVKDAPAVSPKPGPRVLVLTGGHGYEPSFYALFEGFNWNHEVFFGSTFKRDLRQQYDVLVLYNMEDEIPDAARQHLREFAEAGKGILVMHHALCSLNSWEWYREMVGGAYWRKPPAGTAPSTYKHDQELVVRPVARHPIVAGIPEFHLTDETYKGQWMSPGAQVLLTVDHPDSDRAVAWVSAYSKSRVAVLQLGHDHMAHENPLFRTLVTNALQWTSGARFGKGE